MVFWGKKNFTNRVNIKFSAKKKAAKTPSANKSQMSEQNFIDFIIDKTLVNKITIFMKICTHYFF